MKTLLRTYLILAFACQLMVEPIAADQSSEFNEETIRSIQESTTASDQFNQLVQEFTASSNPAIKAQKWEAILNEFGQSLLAVSWEDSDNWDMVDFPATGVITIEEVAQNAELKAAYTRLAAKDESEAARLRGIGSLLRTMVSDGEEWAEELILDISQRSNTNLKWITFWFAKNFGQDANKFDYPINWTAWENAYMSANALGKAIILQNITMIAIRSGEIDAARRINLEALSSSNRQLQAIAIAFGHPDLGSEVIDAWETISEDTSDSQLQALANEALSKYKVE